MKGTVNGKSLDQVLSELKAPFPEEELKKNEKNETYIPVESLESRLNSVIGVLNYDTWLRMKVSGSSRALCGSGQDDSDYL